MVQSIIFDMDGTIFNISRILEVSLEDTFNYLRSLNEWDKETPIEKYREIMGVPLSIVWETFLPNHSKEVRRSMDIYFHEKLIDNIRKGNGALYPNVKEIFNYLKEKNYLICIASNGQVKYLTEILSYYNLDKWITETFSIEQLESLNKSDLVKMIVKKYGITKGAVVGDRLSDINAAKDNGLVAIGCKFDFSQENELSQADIVINDLIELKKLYI